MKTPNQYLLKAINHAVDWTKVLSLVYRPPNTDVNHSLNTTIIDQVNKEKRTCYLMGHYNKDLLELESHPQTSEVLVIMYRNNFVPVIIYPLEKD